MRSDLAEDGFKGILVLVGPKGSGKTFVGTLVERESDIPFLRVEPIFLALRGDRDPLDADYIAEGFSRVEELVLEQYAAARRRPIPHDLTLNNVGLADEEIVRRIADALRSTG